MFDVCFVELCEGDDVDVIFLCVENVVCMGCIFDVLVEIDVLLELVQLMMIIWIWQVKKCMVVVNVLNEFLLNIVE